MSSSVKQVDPRLELDSDQLSLLRQFKQWVEEEADFYRRTDEDFLVLFLRSCDFDLKLSKKTLRLYYQARIKYPEWWANRDLNADPHIQNLLKKSLCYALSDRINTDYPAVMVVHALRMGPDSSTWNPAGKYFTCAMEVASRRSNCQLNGGVIILDFSNCYSWIMWNIIWPPYIRNMVHSYLLCVPMRINTIVLVNTGAFTSAVVALSRSFLPAALKHKIQCCKSLQDVRQFVPLEILPAEWGGDGGPVKEHEDESLSEALSWVDYFVDDDKYGYNSN